MSGTNLGKMPILIVALVIGIVMATTAIVPLVSDYSEAKTFTNEGFFRMSHYDDTTDHEVTWTYEKPNVMTVDGEDVTINCTVSAVTVVADTDFLVRMNFDDQNQTVNISYMYSTSGQKIATVADSQTATFTFTSGTVSISCGSYTGSNTYTDIYLPDNEGDLLMKSPDIDAYINGDSAIIGFGLTRINTYSGTVASPGVGFEFVGTYDDGITGRIWRDVGTTTVSNETINVVEQSYYQDLYLFKSITATATYTETVDDETVSTNTDLTYNFVIVPYEVVGIPDNPDSYKALVKVIPVMAFVALIAAAAFMIYSKRD